MACRTATLISHAIMMTITTLTEATPMRQVQACLSVLTLLFSVNVYMNVL